MGRKVKKVALSAGVVAAILGLGAWGVVENTRTTALENEALQAQQIVISKASYACSIENNLESLLSQATSLELPELASIIEEVSQPLSSSIHEAINAGAMPCNAPSPSQTHQTLVIEAASPDLNESNTEEWRKLSMQLSSNSQKGVVAYQIAKSQIDSEYHRLAFESATSMKGELEEGLSEANAVSELDSTDEAQSSLKEAISNSQGYLDSWDEEATTEGLSTWTAEAKTSLGKLVESKEFVKSEANRIEEERAAAREAARRAQANNFYSSGNSWNSSSSGSSSYNSNGGGDSSSNQSYGGYTLYASNCGGEPQACVDSSSVTYIDYGSLQWVGGHNSGAAGIISSFQVGDTVTVVGSGASGTYRITGHTWVPKQSGISISSVPSGFAFQTCVGNQMVLAYASRI